MKCGCENAKAAGRDDDACPRCGAIYAKARATGSHAVKGGYPLDMDRAPAACVEAPAPAKQASPLLWGGIVLVLPLGFLFPSLFGPGSPMVKQQMADIHQQVADDQIREYNIARQHGAAIDACVHAGMVAAAFLQAQKEGQYAQWKQTESADCGRAGLPR